MIELYLSSDGKHTVHVSADTPEQLRDLVPAAKVLYREVVAEFGAKSPMLPEATPAPSNGHTAVGQRIDTVAQAQAAVTPHCPLHKTAAETAPGSARAVLVLSAPKARWSVVSGHAGRDGHGKRVRTGCVTAAEHTDGLRLLRRSPSRRVAGKVYHVRRRGAIIKPALLKTVDAVRHHH